ncbi:hypothetical protein [Streptomyces sp. Ag109_G2-15]|nr:hypothetical protein [Streptomyces sp. Ag109_G2-15]SOE07825.1 hypothetical protein SAMN06272765_8741 [Streptomyces sp. Ag109_G2-15]
MISDRMAEILRLLQTEEPVCGRGARMIVKVSALPCEVHFAGHSEQ